MATLAEDFQKKGVSLLPRLCAPQQIKVLYQSIQTNIKRCASELRCSTGQYLRNVSRWVAPSPITHDIYAWSHTFFKEILSKIFEQEVILTKLNIISKSPYACHRVPCHQDIAYSREQPYEFSLWFALNDVALQDGVLEFLPGSHLGSIAPAVDFWQPDFVDEMSTSPVWQENFISFPVQAADAILFDSRIWHRSADSQSNRNRFAIVTRWRQIDYRPPSNIPEKIPASFGMWTCSQFTESLLQQGLAKCFNHQITADFTTYIYLWIDKFKQKAELPFAINRIQAQQALEDLLILHQAAQRHNGSDAQGIVYSNVWIHFLEPLSAWLAPAQNLSRAARQTGEDSAQEPQCT